MADKLTVVLVDDHALVRKGFRRMLEDDSAISVVGEASNGEDAVRLALELKPKVVVMDCALPGINGIEATRRIRAKMPDAAGLMLSMHSDDNFVRQALEGGGAGHIFQKTPGTGFVGAPKRVPRGGLGLGSPPAKRPAPQ